jgi:hypothetical protein
VANYKEQLSIVHVGHVHPESRKAILSLFDRQSLAAILTVILKLLVILLRGATRLTLRVEFLRKRLDDMSSILRGVSHLNIKKGVENGLCSTKPFCIICAKGVNDHI